MSFSSLNRGCTQFQAANSTHTEWAPMKGAFTPENTPVMKNMTHRKKRKRVPTGSAFASNKKRALSTCVAIVVYDPNQAYVFHTSRAANTNQNQSNIDQGQSDLVAGRIPIYKNVKVFQILPSKNQKEEQMNEEAQQVDRNTEVIDNYDDEKGIRVFVQKATEEDEGAPIPQDDEGAPIPQDDDDNKKEDANKNGPTNNSPKSNTVCGGSAGGTKIISPAGSGASTSVTNSNNNNGTDTGTETPPSLPSPPTLPPGHRQRDDLACYSTPVYYPNTPEFQSFQQQLTQASNAGAGYVAMSRDGQTFNALVVPPSVNGTPTINNVGPVNVAPLTWQTLHSNLFALRYGSRYPLGNPALARFFYNLYHLYPNPALLDVVFFQSFRMAQHEYTNQYGRYGVAPWRYYSGMPYYFEYQDWPNLNPNPADSEEDDSEQG